VHQHVVGVYAVEEAGGLPYLVMEYVPGRSLQERLDRQGPLTLAEILRIGMQAAAGLAAAHSQGLVHRDVKPANILLENGVERARLTDFGLARAVADAALTQSGVIAGTPYYMAPEQARGEAVDHRADLFSLGSTLYAMCTGHPPFRAESALAVLRRVSDDEPRPIAEINPEIPAWLSAIIGRLHAKDPDKRFQTAAEVAGLLGACLAHVQQPLVVPLPRGLESTTRNSKPTRRLRWALIAIFAGILAVAALLALRPWHKFAWDTVDQSIPSDLRGPGRGADDIDEGIGTAWDRVRSIDADVHRIGLPPQDALSERIRRLVEFAQDLQLEIAPQPGAPAEKKPLQLK
jgi:serine/threonine-protein kinase